MLLNKLNIINKIYLLSYKQFLTDTFNKIFYR